MERKKMIQLYVFTLLLLVLTAPVMASVQSASNPQAPTGATWIEGSGIHWAYKGTEYWTEPSDLSGAISNVWNTTSDWRTALDYSGVTWDGMMDHPNNTVTQGYTYGSTTEGLVGYWSFEDKRPT
ncbi:MAG: hypothetical protein ABEJ62_02155, partial [Candidatus Nanohaloarchaea archaeon]